MPFPTQFPAAQMQHIVLEMTGQGSEPVKRLVEDAYDVLGYGLYIGLGSPADGPPLMLKVSPELCHEDKVQLLEDTLHPQATNIPWDLILPIVMDLLKKWLGG